jgi:D-beta-D-heptose 7-phosphate kinase/D-beta-D-heptose 1-phosphate adenosyltransferase
MLRATKKKILVIGDFTINQFYYGKIKGINPESPIPIVSVSTSQMFLGAAGMIVETLKKLGATNLIPCGVIGYDDYGKWLIKNFSTLEIPTSTIITNYGGKTSRISRIVVDDIQVSRFEEISEEISKENENKMIGMLKKEIQDAKLVIIADYGLGTLKQNIIDNIIQQSIKRKISVFVSSTKRNYLRYKDPSLMIKINMENALLMIDEKTSNKIGSEMICKKLEENLRVKKILLTKGSDGIAIYENGVTIEIPATQNMRGNIYGVGEVMIAVVALALINSNNFFEACKIGNIASGTVISKNGPEGISKKAILQGKKEYDEWLDQK